MKLKTGKNLDVEIFFYVLFGCVIYFFTVALMIFDKTMWICFISAIAFRFILMKLMTIRQIKRCKI